MPLYPTDLKALWPAADHVRGMRPFDILGIRAGVLEAKDDDILAGADKIWLVNAEESRQIVELCQLLGVAHCAVLAKELVVSVAALKPPVEDPLFAGHSFNYSQGVGFIRRQ